MLINAAQFPGPALFQGLGLIVVSVIVVIHAFRKDKTQNDKARKQIADEIRAGLKRREDEIRSEIGRVK